ncbi:M28 family peptidase [Nonomuraea ferruginea]
MDALSRRLLGRRRPRRRHPARGRRLAGRTAACPPAGRDAPPGSFSVERAWPVLERIAGEPTPVGSAAGDAVRDHLVAELTRLGLRPEVQTGASAHPFGGDVVAGVTENVIAVVPGADSTGRVVLAAHYDSTPTTPGASDDKASVAAILEIARALRAGPPLRNDLVLLLSDGEEPGLIGAEAFLRHPMARDGGVVVNLEGPGNAAPSSVYNVTPRRRRPGGGRSRGPCRTRWASPRWWGAYRGDRLPLRPDRAGGERVDRDRPGARRRARLLPPSP